MLSSPYAHACDAAIRSRMTPTMHCSKRNHSNDNATHSPNIHEQDTDYQSAGPARAHLRTRHGMHGAAQHPPGQWHRGSQLSDHTQQMRAHTWGSGRSCTSQDAS